MTADRRREPELNHPQATRRDVLQVGYSGLLGLGLSQALAGRSPSANAAPLQPSAARKPKQVVIVFLTGAASHHDTFDCLLYTSDAADE